MTADFSSRVRAAGRRGRHLRPPSAGDGVRRFRFREILERTARSRLELDAVIAGAPAMPEYDNLPVISPYLTGQRVVAKPKPAKPAPKLMLPKKRQAPDGFRLHSLPAPDDNDTDGGEKSQGRGEEERAGDSSPRQAAARDLDAAADEAAA